MGRREVGVIRVFPDESALGWSAEQKEVRKQAVRNRLRDPILKVLRFRRGKRQCVDLREPTRSGGESPMPATRPVLATGIVAESPSAEAQPVDGTREAPESVTSVSCRRHLTSDVARRWSETSNSRFRPFVHTSLSTTSVFLQGAVNPWHDEKVP